MDEVREYAVGFRFWYLTYVAEFGEGDTTSQQISPALFRPLKARRGLGGRHIYPYRGELRDTWSRIDDDTFSRLLEGIGVTLPPSLEELTGASPFTKPTLTAVSRDFLWAPRREHSISCRGQLCHRNSEAAFSLARCRCGFYAFHSLENLVEAWLHGFRLAKGPKMAVAGLIRARGSAVVGERGFRAEKAEVAALLDASAVGGDYLDSPESVSPARLPHTLLDHLGEHQPERDVLEELAARYSVPLLSREEISSYSSLVGSSLQAESVEQRERKGAAKVWFESLRRERIILAGMAVLAAVYWMLAEPPWGFLLLMGLLIGIHASIPWASGVLARSLPYRIFSPPGLDMVVFLMPMLRMLMKLLMGSIAALMVILLLLS